MLSDANATWSDEDHAATLNNLALFFGDVLIAEQAIGMLVPTRSRRTAQRATASAWAPRLSPGDVRSKRETYCPQDVAPPVFGR